MCSPTYPLLGVVGGHAWRQHIQNESVVWFLALFREEDSQVKETLSHSCSTSIKNHRRDLKITYFTFQILLVRKLRHTNDYFLIKFIYFSLKDDCFTVLCWFLPNIHMNQPLVYLCPPPSWISLPSSSPPHPSRLLQSPSLCNDYTF